MNEAEKNTLKEVREKWLTELRQVGEVLNVLFPAAEHVQSLPPTRESLLEWARSTRSLRPKERREQVLRLVEESLSASAAVSVAEIFEAAYGDPTGKDYWRLWLRYEQSEDAIGKLLATHFRAENQDAAAAGHPFGWGWEGCCCQALGRYPSGEVVDRLRSIAEDEELGYLIAPSARAFLVSGLPAQNGKRRGPRPVQMLRVRASDQFHRLDDMTEEEMVAHFSASRDTCRKARDTIRSEK